MDNMSILVPRLVRSLGLDRMIEVEHDKFKSMDDKVVRAVERSTISAAQIDYPTALQEAKEASRAFEVLKRSVHANNGPGAEPGETLPMTTGVNLFDLSIMVKCNLAARLKDNGKLEESLELYTQICKMAIDQAGSPAGSLVSDTSANQQQQQQLSRYLLFRFGLEIGNILYESREYQRALKYYRLTLDRLSSMSGNRNLRIKLMNNITVALMTMNGIVIGDETHRSSLLLSSRGTNDHVTSLQLLLADNLLDRPQNQQIPVQAQPFGFSSSSSNTSRSQLVSKSVNVHKHPLNSHHHKFGLNLLTCQYESRDMSAMWSTLKSLVMVDVCHQYKRVFKCGGQSSALDVEIGLSTRKPSFQSAGSDRLTESAAHAAADSMSARTLLSAPRLSSPTDTHKDGAPIIELSPASAVDENLATDIDADGRCPKRADDAIRTRLVMRCLQEDKLEKAISKKEAEVRRALIISCNLMIDLSRAHHRDQKQQGHNQSRVRPYSLSTSDRINLDDDKLDRQPGIVHVDEPSSRVLGGTSSFGQCVSLLETTDLYKELIVDLKTNNALGLLSKKGQLSIALRALEKIDPYQQVSTSNDLSLLGSGNSTKLSSARTTTGDRTATQHCSSKLVATNFGLIYLLKNQTQFALDLFTKALASTPGDHHKAEILVNIAKCYSNMDQPDQADRSLAKAYGFNQRLWLINYNRLLAKVKLGHHYDDLDIDTRKTLSDHTSRDVGLRPRGKRILTQVQLARLHHQSNMKSDTNDLLLSLLNTTRLSPDILLLASKLIEEVEDSGPQNHRMSPVSILQRCLRLHPYHLASAERLIALLIDKFEYQEARSVLLDCIKNRPDQVKWLLMYAECHRRAANYNEAIKLYKYTIELFPLDTSSIRALAKLADELGLQEELRTCQARLQQLSGNTQL